MVQTCILIWLGLITKILFQSHSTSKANWRPAVVSKPCFLCRARLMKVLLPLTNKFLQSFSKNIQKSQKILQNISKNPNECPKSKIIHFPPRSFRLGLISQCVRAVVEWYSSLEFSVNPIQERVFTQSPSGKAASPYFHSNMMSANFSDFLTPPVSAFGSNLYYKIHAISPTTSAFPWPHSPFRSGHHIWTLPYCNSRPWN